MMTLRDYEFLQRIEREKEEGKAKRRIVRRQYTREERKRLRTGVLALLAAICMVSVLVASFLDNSGDDPTRVLPLQKPEQAEELPIQILDPAPVLTGVDVLGEFAVVAYCSCFECCGPWALDRPLDENGEEIVYTASGARAEAGVTVAVDPDIIPLGSKVYIEELGWYVAQDTGSFSGKVVDVYFEDHAAACEFGRRDAMVSVVAADG